VNGASGIVAAALVCLAACTERNGPYAAFVPGTAPPEVHRGEVVFNTYCVSCHGRFGRGEGLGPPMLDAYFLPGQLPDEAWTRAITRGTPQARYHYGAMPPVKPVGPPDIPEVIRYVRWLQQRAGDMGFVKPTGGSGQ
jgi:mono/diheme cytochrome c family protein